MRGAYQTHRQELLMTRERNMLPEARVLAVEQRKQQMCIAEIRALNLVKADLQLHVQYWKYRQGDGTGHMLYMLRYVHREQPKSPHFMNIYARETSQFARMLAMFNQPRACVDGECGLCGLSAECLPLNIECPQCHTRFCRACISAYLEDVDILHCATCYGVWWGCTTDPSRLLGAHFTIQRKEAMLVRKSCGPYPELRWHNRVSVAARQSGRDARTAYLERRQQYHPAVEEAIRTRDALSAENIGRLEDVCARIDERLYYVKMRQGYEKVVLRRFEAHNTIVQECHGEDADSDDWLQQDPRRGHHAFAYTADWRRGVEPDAKRPKRVEVIKIKPCPVNNCIGYLSTQWKCNTCEQYTCRHCRVAVGSVRDMDAHTCDTDMMENVRVIAANTKPCPSCGVPIMKSQGCSQMYCTQCHTAFDWGTLKITRGIIHNPHYYEYQNARAGGVLRRQLGDLPCGGLPDWTTIPDDLTSGIVLMHHASVGHYLAVAEGLRPPTGNVNVDIAIKFVSGDITEVKWKTLLQRREKKAVCDALYRELLQSYTELITDVLQRGVQQHTGMMSHEVPVQSRHALEQELCLVRDYINDQIERLNRVYGLSRATVAMVQVPRR